MQLCPRRRCGFALPDQRVNAPAPGAIKNHEQEEPAIKDGQFSFVRKLGTRTRDREEFRHTGQAQRWSESENTKVDDRIDSHDKSHSNCVKKEYACERK